MKKKSKKTHVNRMSITLSDSVTIALPRTPLPFKALRIQRPQHHRTGSSEYALIPSRFGSIRKLLSGEVID